MTRPLNSERPPTDCTARSWLSGFRRITTTGEYIPEIDGLRFIAITCVVFLHLGTYVGNFGHPDIGIFSIGGKGVELFFVISGFVLATPFVRYRLAGGKPVRLKPYFLRRLTRLEPPYLL